MKELIILSKLIFLISGMRVKAHDQGIAAYYADGLMHQVCRHRVNQQWNPQLDCSFPCLISAIEPEHIGEYWLVDVPGASLHV